MGEPEQFSIPFLMVNMKNRWQSRLGRKDASENIAAV
jgi:hypothetical protein